MLLAFLVDSSTQEGHSAAERLTRAYSGGGSPWYGGGYEGGFRRGYGNYEGYGGYGSMKRFGGMGGYGGYGGNRGYGSFGGYGGYGGYGGSLGADGYGFKIVDTPEKYGYEAVYPNGYTNFYLLGPVGPGKRSIYFTETELIYIHDILYNLIK